MTFQLENIVPWGRTFEEYTQMFALTEQDLQGKIAGCADGPASFNATATQQGYQVTSFDPVYAFSGKAIQSRIEAIRQMMLEETQRNEHLFDWETFGSPQGLVDARLEAMRLFLTDYEQGKITGRYIEAELPHIPVPDDAFNLALCSHFLFLYTEQVTLEIHLASVLELCRIAREVRIFPLNDLSNQLSAHVEPVMAALTTRGYKVQKVAVPYQFRKNDSWMLQIRRGQ